MQIVQDYIAEHDDASVKIHLHFIIDSSVQSFFKTHFIKVAENIENNSIKSSWLMFCLIISLKPDVIQLIVI